MIPRETVEQILDSAQIVDVVSDYVTLKRRGANYVACCPFHNEKTPSFYVSPAKGLYKCFGCGKSGTAVGFVMEQEHCSYVEALRYLARKYHIQIVEEEESAEELAQRQRRESLLLVSEFACKFFCERLKSGDGLAVGHEYFRSRGLEEDTIERFSLGWAPRGGRELVDAATAAGYKLEYLIDAGLAVRHEDGSVSDKFRERVMFPIHSVSGRVLAFSGRTLRSDNPAKYVNSPETEIYVKSRNLLGIWFAKGEISRLDKCILVEGNMDMVMMHQLGIRNVVASCGTSLTAEQIRLIHKFTENITIMYDGDSAGIHAAVRGINMILAEGMNVKTVLLPDGEDPDSFSKKHSLEEVLRYIESSEKDFVAFKTQLLIDEAADDPLKKANLINDIADTIAEIPDAVKRSTYVEYTSAQFNIEPSILFSRISRRRSKILEDRRKEQERQARRAADDTRSASYDGVNDRTYGGMYSQSGGPVPEESVSVARNTSPENRILGPIERDLLFFLLTHGTDRLEFESDSEYYPGEGEEAPTVAEFIRDALESDGTEMADPVHASVYASYMERYDLGLDQQEIVKSLLDSPDRLLAEVVASLSSEKYQLTVDSFERSMTTTSSWLVNYVPKAIMIYGEYRLQCRVESLIRSLKGMPAEEQLPAMQEIMRLQNIRRKIRQKTGREKIQN